VRQNKQAFPGPLAAGRGKSDPSESDERDKDPSEARQPNNAPSCIGAENKNGPPEAGQIYDGPPEAGRKKIHSRTILEQTQILNKLRS
jgi:hypothetical protein